MPYQVLPDSEFAENQPIRGITQIAMRDNLIAVAAGEANAPRIQPAALWNVTNGSAIVTPLLGRDAETATDLAGSQHDLLIECFLLTTGSFTISWTRDSGTSSIQVQRNGATVYTGTALSFSAINYNAGDIIRFGGQATLGQTNPIRITNIRFSTANLPCLAIASNY